jgi:hypothetical protein
MIATTALTIFVLSKKLSLELDLEGDLQVSQIGLEGMIVGAKGISAVPLVPELSQK